MSAVQLEYAVPSAGIAEWITLFYHFRADVPVLEDTERADHAQLRFRLSEGAAEYRMPDGSTQIAPPIHVIGPTSGAMQVKVAGPIHAFASSTGPESLVGQRPTLARSVAPHASHWLMLDAPQWFHQQLVRFLGECRHTH